MTSYHICSLWSSTTQLCENAYRLFMSVYTPLVKKGYDTRLTVSSKVTYDGFEYVFNVVDLDAPTISNLKKAGRDFIKLLPRDSFLCLVYAYYWHLKNNVPVLVSVDREIQETEYPHLTLGVNTLKDQELSVFKWEKPTQQQQQVPTSEFDRDGQNPSTWSNAFDHPFDHQVKEKEKEITQEELDQLDIEKIERDSFDDALRSIMGWKPWNIVDDHDLPMRCMCRFREATYAAYPCEQLILCEVCFFDYMKHPVLCERCPKCRKPAKTITCILEDIPGTERAYIARDDMECDEKGEEEDDYISS